MNWKLVFTLSLFGLAMGVGTVFLIPQMIEPLCWLFIFILCAVNIAKSRKDKHFLHGFAVSMVNSVWITAAHVIFLRTYLDGHPGEAAFAAQMGWPRLMMIVTGPVIGALSGCVLGLFAFIAGKFVKPAEK